MTQIDRKPPRQPQRVNEPDAHLRQVGSFPTEAHVTTSLPQRAACRPVPPECACVCVSRHTRLSSRLTEHTVTTHPHDHIESSASRAPETGGCRKEQVGDRSRLSALYDRFTYGLVYLPVCSFTRHLTSICIPPTLRPVGLSSPPLSQQPP